MTRFNNFPSKIPLPQSEPRKKYERLRDYLRKTDPSLYHPVGTCKVGNDAMAVVNSGLQVQGIEGLRVVDASIMPTIIGGNTNALRRSRNSGFALEFLT